VARDSLLYCVVAEAGEKIYLGLVRSNDGAKWLGFASGADNALSTFAWEYAAVN